MPLTKQQEDLCTQNQWDFSGLAALFLNCTLKKSPARSNTRGLMDVPAEIMRKCGISVEIVRPIDFPIASGVQPDMTEHGWPKDAWPDLYKKVQTAEILVIGTPIWLGDKSSVCTQVIERMYGNSAELNDRGQYAYYGKWADASSPATKTAPNIAP